MNSFIIESFFYLIAAGAIQVAVVFLILPIFAPLALRLREPTFHRILGGYFFFNLFLLFWGAIGHYVFLQLTLGKLYVSVDRLADWLPFIPFGQWVLDQSLGDRHGQLLGSATLGQLRLIWLAVAAPVWLLTGISTWLVIRPRAGRFTRSHAIRCA